MHKPAESPMEVRRVTFSDALTSPDSSPKCTRAATLQATSMGQSMAMVGTSMQANSKSGLSSNPQSEPATQEMIISDDLASLVIPR